MSDNSVRYIPPSEESIQAFAQLLCERLATARNDVKFTRPEVISGLAHFLKLTMNLEAKLRSTPTPPITNTYLPEE